MRWELADLLDEAGRAACRLLERDASRPARWAKARPAHWEPQTDVAGQLSISFASPARKGPIGAPTPVERAQLADDILRVQAAGRLRAGRDILWTVRLNPQYLLRKLRDGIAALDQAPLADKLAADVFDPVRRAPGKTRVLAKAIEDMVSDGKGCC